MVSENEEHKQKQTVMTTQKSFEIEWMTNFDLLESVLDDHVGKEITLQIRRGDQNLSISFTVQDLHSITPDRFVEIGGAVVVS